MDRFFRLHRVSDSGRYLFLFALLLSFSSFIDVRAGESKVLSASPNSPWKNSSENANSLRANLKPARRTQAPEMHTKNAPETISPTPGPNSNADARDRKEPTPDDLRLALSSRGSARTLEMEATAYGPPLFPQGQTTKSGAPVGPGSIAVDPSVIRLGTQLFVEGYGFGIANDTGALIVGDRIDVWLPSEKECLEWGRRRVKVMVFGR